MEIKVLEKSKNFLKIEIVGEDHTFCNALRKELWNDKDVKVSGYELSHSFVSNPILIVETSSKNPKAVLNDAVKRLKQANDEMRSAFKKLK
ncbi:MAG: DNA-directed RNA polymerase subunit L [Candidatus Nanoarchaeia archaeon]